MPYDGGELPEVLVTPDRPNGQPGTTIPWWSSSGHGGTADTWNPHGNTPSSYDFVIPGVPTNLDPATASIASRSSAYPGGPGAAVQRALGQLGVQSVPGDLWADAPYFGPTGFAIFVFGQEQTARMRTEIETPGVISIRGLSNTGRRATRQDITKALMGASVSHPLEMWLSPADHPAWFMGNGVDDWPVDLPDWNAPAPHHPISGSVSDFPTEQEIEDAGNPATWLSSAQVGHTIDHNGRALFPALSYSGPGPGNMTPILSFDATQGNVTSDVTPQNVPSWFVAGDPNGMPWLLSNSVGPPSYFGPWP